MSAYIEFYIRSKKNEFIPIGTYSRSDGIFQAFHRDLVYGENIPVTADMIEDIKETCMKHIEGLYATIDREKELMEQIAKFNDSIETRVELIAERFDNISEYECAIKENNRVIAFIEHLEFLLDAAQETKWNSEEHRYDANQFIYAGYEANWPGEDNDNED